MLVSADAWRMCTPKAYYTLDYSNAGATLLQGRSPSP